MPFIFVLATLTSVTNQDQPVPPPTIAVWIRDGGQVPLDILSGAKSEVTQIYRAAGVNIAWHRPAGPVDGSDSQPTRLVIDIVSSRQAGRLPFPPSCDTLGAATGNAIERGHVGYVRYDCIEHLAQHSGLDRAHALGVVVSHELGHLLLPYPAHSMTGLMKAEWSRDDLYLAQRRSLIFTPEQAQLIRTRLVSGPGHEVANDGLFPSAERKHWRSCVWRRHTVASTNSRLATIIGR
jgi:hypothetical protein